MKDVLLFDMDGTLIDSDLMLVSTWEEMYDAFRPGYKPHLKDLLRFSGPPLEDSLKGEFPNVPYEKTRAYWMSHCAPYYDRFVTSFPKERQTLLALKEAGYRLGVVTNKARDFAAYSLKITGLDGIFDVLIGDEDLMRLKPDPEGIYVGMSRFGEKEKAKVTYIGDTVYDFMAAKNAGVSFLLAHFCLRDIPEGVKEDQIASSWDDIARRFLDGKNL